MAAAAAGAAATPLTRRWLGVRLAVATFGVIVTIVALVAALSLGTGGPFDPLGGLSRDANAALDQIDMSLGHARDSLSSAEATLDGAKASVADASAVSTSLSGAMDALADASSAEVLGIQPFAGLAPRFRELATNSSSLARSLDSTQASIGVTRTDLAGLSDDLRSLSETLSRLGADAQHGSKAGGGSATRLRLLLAAALAWLAATAAVSLADAWRAWKGAAPAS